MQQTFTIHLIDFIRRAIFAIHTHTHIHTRPKGPAILHVSVHVCVPFVRGCVCVCEKAKEQKSAKIIGKLMKAPPTEINGKHNNEQWLC